MDAAGNLNLTSIPSYAKYLSASGVDGVVLSGIAGEGPNLCVREKKSLYDAWAMFAKRLGLRLILQIGGASLPDIIELAAYANVLHVDAILVLPTVYYNDLSVEELTCLMQEISRAAPSIPFLYYDYPDWSNVHVDMTEFFRSALADIPQFRGILTDFATTLEILASNEVPNQRLFVYNHVLTTGAVPNGYDTFVVAAANIAPRMYLNIIRAAQEQDFTEARALLLRFIQLIREITARSNRISAAKVATELTTGITLGNPRIPLPPVDEEGRQYIISVLRRYDLRVA